MRLWIWRSVILRGKRKSHSSVLDGSPGSRKSPGGRMNLKKRRPRRMAIDSGTIAKSGDGSTAPSGALDGTDLEQVGASTQFRRRNHLCPRNRPSNAHIRMPDGAKPLLLRPGNSFGKRFTTSAKASTGYATQSRQLPSACPRRERQE